MAIRDDYSKLKDIYPGKSKETIDTEWSIADFCGDRLATKAYHNTMYSDQEDSIKAACKNLKIKSEFSQPGVPRNSAMIERTIGDILEGARTLLRTAGLPAMFWIWAAMCCCFHENVGIEDADDTPWFLTHTEHRKGMRLPFGCAVRYLPNRTRKEKKKKNKGNLVYKDKQAKWDARSRLGIFVGYDMHPGYSWSKRYLVWDLDAFQGGRTCSRQHQRF